MHATDNRIKNLSCISLYEFTGNGWPTKYEMLIHSFVLPLLGKPSLRTSFQNAAEKSSPRFLLRDLFALTRSWHLKSRPTKGHGQDELLLPWIVRPRGPTSRLAAGNGARNNDCSYTQTHRVVFSSLNTRFVGRLFVSVRLESNLYFSHNDISSLCSNGRQLFEYSSASKSSIEWKTVESA